MKTLEMGLPTGIEWIDAEDEVLLGEALAAAVAAELEGGLADAERVTLVVSGGSTPLPFLKALSQIRLPWQRVDVVLADERWVAEFDPASNAAQVRRHLIQNQAARATLVPFKQPGDLDAEACAVVESQLQELAWPATAVVLGMGKDGHTASLFADAPQLDTGLDPNTSARVAMMTPPSQDHARMTLTRNVLQSGTTRFLHIRGDDKLRALRHACEDLDNVEAMPVRAFLNAGLRIYWSP
ncbi:6-phosphogluconolactonase [Marinobacter sp. X15-166B]|uniref:6-phosphogluconolactonase n=1 Tax=Marinobacter sp. X15-166B TaxID=1897620 RepID=UPI00085C52B7|nr:6-phosphogluconolactonase [Marinobacter sp. X15-166B]OEY67173.1 6-phosphogluconolactonase [Marinobacter sp. X15-166B]